MRKGTGTGHACAWDRKAALRDRHRPDGTGGGHLPSAAAEAIRIALDQPGHDGEDMEYAETGPIPAEDGGGWEARPPRGSAYTSHAGLRAYSGSARRLIARAMSAMARPGTIISRGASKRNIRYS